jgi:CheY-like chemotaxis protein
VPNPVIAVVDDMIFISKIRAVAESQGVTVRFLRNIDAVFSAAREAPPPPLIIIDLHSQKIDPLELATGLKADPELSTIPLLGFYSHVETELRQQAEAAGFDRVMPRSSFTANLAEIISPS